MREGLTYATRQARIPDQLAQAFAGDIEVT
jgi:hypothetical protein